MMMIHLLSGENWDSKQVKGTAQVGDQLTGGAIPKFDGPVDGGGKQRSSHPGKDRGTQFAASHLETAMLASNVARSQIFAIPVFV
jgi:hypothetical protein